MAALIHANEIAEKDEIEHARIEEMRTLVYDNTKPMDLKVAIPELRFNEGDVPCEKEILNAWHYWMRRTKTKTFNSEKRLNQARDVLLGRLKEPEYQDAMHKAKALKEEEALRKAEALLAKEAEALKKAEALRAKEAEALNEVEAPRDEEPEVDELQAAKLLAEQKEKSRRERADAEYENTDRTKRPRGPQEEPNERPANFMAPPAKKPESGKRKHRKTSDIDGLLIADMNRVFAERFEEAQDKNVPVNEVYEVFRQSTSLANPKYSVFKHHYRKIFRAKWTHSQVVFKGNGNFFTDMAVKRP
jgi:hypothetical protein